MAYECDFGFAKWWDVEGEWMDVGSSTLLECCRYAVRS